MENQSSSTPASDGSSSCTSTSSPHHQLQQLSITQPNSAKVSNIATLILTAITKIFITLSIDYNNLQIDT